MSATRNHAGTDLTSWRERLSGWTEAVCWAGGFAACSLFALARADGEYGRKEDLAAFAGQLDAPDQSLWSASRIRAYQSTRANPADMPVAVLTVPSLNLEVPVYSQASELSLNRGAGLIDGMGFPDRGGNVGIAGHRDGYFRVLKGIREGDLIELRTRLKRHRYRVSSIEIVDETNTGLLADTELPSVTLVTCYPFYFVGSAPQRFIVRGSYEWKPAATPGNT